MAISGIAMWWIRRPKGASRLVAPPLPKDLPLWKSATVLMLVISVFFPLAGITLLSLLVLDLVVLSRVPVLKRAFS